MFSGLSWVVESLEHPLNCPAAVIFASGNSCKVVGRHVGGLTGSRIAVALARIPVQSMVAELKFELEHLAFLGRASLGVYVDNLFSVSSSASGVISILEKCEQFLEERWNLKFKSSSLEVM